MAGDESNLPIDVAVELERARRLGDRLDACSDGTELAREQRARRLSAEFLSHVSLSSLLGKATQGIAQLEESLESQRRQQLRALASEALLQGPPQPSTPLERQLQRTLEELTVKNLLDFRDSAGQPGAEATATAAVCTVANLEDSVQVRIHSLDPERPWKGAMEVLTKPGHFINSLRRFPQAVANKKVAEENMVAARHFLGMARERDDVSPAVAALQRWVAAAIQFWEAPSKRVEVKTREFKAQVRPMRSLLSPRTPVPQKAPGRGVTVRQVPAEKPQPKSAGQARAKSQDARRPQSPQRQPSPRQPSHRQPSPRQPSPRPQPQRPQRPQSPRPAATPAAPAQTAPQTARRSLSRSASAVARPTAPAPQTARPQTARPQAARSQSVRPQTARGPRSTTPKAAPRAPSSLRSLGSSKSATSLRAAGGGATPTPGSPADLPSVEELKRMIEETKKEVREIRQVESKSRWQIAREERKEKLAQSLATQSELREWRWKQVEGMKSMATQKAQEAKEVELKESKDFVQFKREVKIRNKEQELQCQQEAYTDRKKDAAWKVEKVRETIEQEQALVREKVDAVQELRAEKKQQAEMEKVKTAQDRALQEHLDVAHLAQQLAAEKARLLENLNFSRSCLQAPMRRR